MRFVFLDSRLRSALPPHARSPLRRCASLRLQWPTHGRTSTSKIAPMLGAHDKAPPKRGLSPGIADYRLRLRVAARPARPRPRRARVVGSGTATSFTKMEKPFRLVMLLNASEKESPL